MIEHQTVGELRAALASLPDDSRLCVLFEGRCVESSGLAVLGLHDGAVPFYDADGDDKPFLQEGFN